jgi:hypothetical protein
MVFVLASCPLLKFSHRIETLYSRSDRSKAVSRIASDLVVLSARMC